MSVTFIVGTQWGDEGKGKIAHLFSLKADIVARYAGGPNAGHTVVDGGKKYILHQLPVGILNPKTICIMGNGMVIDPMKLMHEISKLTEKQKLLVLERLLISQRAHLILPYHQFIDGYGKQGKKIGTTGRGIGPAYVDKVDRTGIRMLDLINPNENNLLEKIQTKLNEIAKNFSPKKRAELYKFANPWQIYSQLSAYGLFFAKNIVDTGLYLYQAMESGQNILLEGAQGTLLDIDHGTYPFVTSSNSTAGGACTGLGIGPTKINKVIGVVKAYTTRVGNGPFPTELRGKEGQFLQEKGIEFGATTGRPRRCGWFDGVILGYAARLNGLTSLALTKLDVLDELEEIKICTGYKYGRETIKEFPADLKTLEDCQPVYETLPGWQSSTREIRGFKQLPKNAQKYINFIGQLTGLPVQIISVGPEAEQTIFR